MRYFPEKTFFLIPYFIEIQRKSFSDFLEKGIIKELFRRNPITNARNDLELVFFPEKYQLTPPEFNPKQAIFNVKTYACKLYVPAQLTNWEENQVTFQWVLLGNLPLMTKRGHFIVNGSPRVIVNQLVRSPGIYYQESIDVTKKKNVYADLISQRGAWLRLEIDKKKRVWAKMKKTPKISILVFLQAMGFDRDFISKTVHFSEFLKNSEITDEKKNIYQPETQEQALMMVYAITHPKYDKTKITIEKGQKFLFRKFFNPRTYDLGYLGRARLNKKLGLSIALTHCTLTPQDVLSAVDYLINLEHGFGSLDDIDHLKNRRVRASGELIQNQFGTGLIRLEKIIREKMKKPKNSLTLKNLITTKALDGALREFFGSSPLSQYMDQTNPLAETTHKRRLSSLGPGGISRETAGMAIRGIHPTHYGRICPIETPEGKNAGLVNSPTILTRVNSQGFLETPFYPVFQGQIQKEIGPFFFSAEQEQQINAAPGDLNYSHLNFLSRNLIPIRNQDEYKRVFRNQVEYIGTSPIQMISVATSLIPFLEHDDANRALMGSNMQRQAVPLINPERPIVGTGLEARVIADSGHIVQASRSGFVSYVSGKKVIIQSYSADSPQKHILLKKKLKRNLKIRNIHLPVQSKSNIVNRNNFLKQDGFKPILKQSVKEEYLLNNFDLNREYNKLISLHLIHIPRGVFKFSISKWSSLATIEARKVLGTRPIRYPGCLNRRFKNVGSLVTRSLRGNRAHKITLLKILLENRNSCLVTEKLIWPEKSFFIHTSNTQTKFKYSFHTNIEKKEFNSLNLNKSFAVLQNQTNILKFDFKYTYQKSVFSAISPILNQKIEHPLKLEIFTGNRFPKSKILKAVKISDLKKEVVGKPQTKLKFSVPKTKTIQNKPYQLKIDKQQKTNFYTKSTFFCFENFISKNKSNFFKVNNQKNNLFIPKNLFQFRNYTTSTGSKCQLPRAGCSTPATIFYSPNDSYFLRGKFSMIAFTKRINTIQVPLLDKLKQIQLEILFQNKIAINFEKSLKNQINHFNEKGNSYVSASKSNILTHPTVSKIKSFKPLVTQRSNLRFDTGSLKSQILTPFKIIDFNTIEPINFYPNYRQFSHNSSNIQDLDLTTKQILALKTRYREYNLQNYHRSNQDTCLHQKPVVQQGEWVQKSDILADCAASVAGELALGKNLLIAYMPWEGYNFEDAILISERLVYDDILTSIHIERYEIEIRDTDFGIEQITKQIPELLTQTNEWQIEHLNEKGIAKLGSWVKEGDILVGKITPMRPKPLSPQENLVYDIVGKKIPTTCDTSLRVPKGVEGRVIKIQILDTESVPSGISFEGPGRVHIYLAEKRKIQVGDKMAGRHGNKGIVSKILPRQDMPYLLDGTPIDMVLNPLGVPSRMNVGQVFECLLGLAGTHLEQQYRVNPFDEVFGPEASRSLVYLKLYQARLKSGQHWLFNPEFPGKTRLFDGRTGDCFDQSVTVGRAYMLKLVHLVDEKIHARSTGPYSLITQQPLGGRSKHGGQRLGEMEVWALEGFGAAYTLQELLTIKSDDVKGRHQVLDAILNNETISLGTPESFKVLVRELQSLCLDVNIFTVSAAKRKSIDIMKIP